MSAPSPTPTPLQIGLVLFPTVTQLDFTGPLQVFSSLPGAKIHLIWKRIEPVTSDSVLVLTPTTTFADCPQLDVICVPGGFGTDDMINDEEMLAFLRQQAPGAKYITSVCTGSLVLGAAGLLKGYRAATHWTAMDFLSAFGAIPTKTRVCVDRNRVTGGGVTAGIDFALTLVSLLHDQTDRGGDPAPARIQSRATVQFRLAGHRAAGSPRLHERQDCAGANPPRRNDRPRRRAAGVAPPSCPRRRASRYAGATGAGITPLRTCASADDDRTTQQRKRPPGFPDDLSCPTAATH